MSTQNLSPRWKKVFFSLGFLLLGLMVLEVLFRLIILAAPDTRTQIVDYQELNNPELDPTIEMAPHPYVVYTFSPDLPEINEWGFTFSDDIPLERSPQTLRILTLGGSTTAGPRAWPFHLGERLKEHNPNKTVEILNFGTGGWTSAESMVAFTTLGQSFQPDIVIVHHAVNDLDPMMRKDFRPDYAHFRKPIALSKDELGRLRLQTNWTFFFDSWGIYTSQLYTWIKIQVSGPSPSVYTLHNLSIHPPKQGLVRRAQLDQHAKTFTRNLRTIGTVASSIDSKVLFATLPYRKGNGAQDTPNSQNPWGPMIAAQNQRVMELARTEKWNTVPLHQLMSSMDEIHFEDQVHVDQTGEKLKAEHIFRTLQHKGMLN